MPPERPNDERPNDLSSDPNAVMSAAGPAARPAHELVTPTGDAPGQDGPALSPAVPERMHRADDDPLARATSPDFSDHPAHVVTGGMPAVQADLDQGADVAARADTARPPAGGGSGGDR